jgi:hypothetical protein
MDPIHQLNAKPVLHSMVLLPSSQKAPSPKMKIHSQQQDQEIRSGRNLDMGNSKIHKQVNG